MNQNGARLWISGEARRGIKDLLASFGHDLWEAKAPVFIRNEQMFDRYMALVASLCKILHTRGSDDDLLRVRGACAYTGWLFAFLEDWYLQISPEKREEIEFCEALAHKVGRAYMMLTLTEGEHFQWTTGGFARATPRRRLVGS